jgi:hypothetical protein
VVAVGIVQALGIIVTTRALTGLRPSQPPAWWLGGVAFIAMELVVHLVLYARRLPSFYDRRR